MNSLVQTLWDAVYPTRCGICGLLGDRPLCIECEAALEPLDSPTALFHYTGIAGEAVRRLKYLRVTPLATPMAAMLAEHYRAYLSGLYDAVIPVPIHWSRRFARGFHQAELLSEAFPKGLVQSRWLSRSRATKPQVRITPEKRATNLAGAFTARRIVAGKRLLLVDDVVTSGATFRACRQALLNQGAVHVDLLAFAGSKQIDL